MPPHPHSQGPMLAFTRSLSICSAKTRVLLVVISELNYGKKLGLRTPPFSFLHPSLVGSWMWSVPCTALRSGEMLPRPALAGSVLVLPCPSHVAEATAPTGHRQRGPVAHLTLPVGKPPSWDTFHPALRAPHLLHHMGHVGWL